MTERSRRKIRTGKIVSAGMDKTVVVMVDRMVQHPLYKKTIKRGSKFLAHDEKNECKEGDLVRIMEIRPMSKRKRWRVVSVLERAK